ncbi:MAG: DUF3488 and transglutaminase-like domain-containing protein, partial [Gammaproteobacteria bacterium]|nr:DUF3488 and transglutaminase-like domain-containing protein [Gammaproteobacteria bacterium]
LSSTSFKTRIRISARMVMQSVPLMLVLFVLFPRIPGPLWGIPEDVRTSRTGISDEMSPGSINNLISSSEVAFRVQFKSEPPEARDLYWRGLVLSNYDGKTWKRDDASIQMRPDTSYIAAEAKIVDYTVMLEPHGQKWLYSLETLMANEGPYIVTRELQVITENEIKSVMQYSMTSNINIFNKGLSEEEKRKNLLLPVGINQRTIDLAKQLRRRSGTNVSTYINTVLGYFRTEPFRYTLSPPLLGGDAMDDFIFRSQQGFCEHYSSAFVYLMRAAGVPARVVIGYQGGTFNPVDDYMIVRQSDAHAWTEVWLDDKGWVRIDPTAAVSPDRIDYGIANAGLEKARLPSILVSNSKLLLQLRYTIDSFNHGWNKWIVGFNNAKQKQLFESLGIDDIDMATLFSWMVVAMTLSGALVAFWVFASAGKKDKQDVAVHYYDVFCRKLEKSGLSRAPSESAEEFLERVVQTFPALEQKAGFITRAYQKMRYGGRRGVSDKTYFIQAVKRFHVDKKIKKMQK